jgi:hypothetical protein
MSLCAASRDVEAAAWALHGDCVSPEASEVSASGQLAVLLSNLPARLLSRPAHLHGLQRRRALVVRRKRQRDLISWRSGLYCLIRLRQVITPEIHSTFAQASRSRASS